MRLIQLIRRIGNMGQVWHWDASESPRLPVPYPASRPSSVPTPDSSPTPRRPRIDSAAQPVGHEP